MAIALDGSSLNLESTIKVAKEGMSVTISPESLRRMGRFRSLLEQKISRGELVYGVDTGIGSLAGRPVRSEDLKGLQLNLIRSHSAGVGDPMPLELVRAAMLIRINTLLIGNSAARPAVVELLASMLNQGVTPSIPRFGSLGASGDLIPSAHMALAMIGEGKAYFKGRLLESVKALASCSLKPLVLEPKEGLSLINGTCFTTALGVIAVHDGGILLSAGDSSVSLTAEALGACSQSFDARLIGLKKSGGQEFIARRLRKYLAGSRRIRHEPLPQDPYSIRCVPQVHGSTKEALDFAERMVMGEMNSVSDNPVLFEDGTVLHGGNFHGQPVAMALDLLSIALSYLGVMSLARINLLLTRTPQDRKYMAHRPGLESGLMILQYTATALAADNASKLYPQSAYPASVSEGIEDHASHGVNAGMKARSVIENVSRILAIELICASNRFPSALDDVSEHSRRVCAVVRSLSPLLQGDRPLSEEIEALTRVLAAGKLP